MRNKNQLTNIQLLQFWQKLNRMPNASYLRFQRMFARYNKGKWIRGASISTLGIVSFILE